MPETDVLARTVVKYKLVVPSVKSSVSFVDNHVSAVAVVKYLLVAPSGTSSDVIAVASHFVPLCFIK